MSKLSSNPRKKRQGVPAIDLDELYNAPNNRGMCSFLELPPEEARLRREQRLAVDEAVSARAGSAVPLPVGETETVEEVLGDLATREGKLQAAGDIPAPVDIQGARTSHAVEGGTHLAVTNESSAASDLSSSGNRQRSELEPASVTLERIAGLNSILLSNGALPGDSRLPGDSIIPSDVKTGATANIPTAGDMQAASESLDCSQETVDIEEHNISLGAGILHVAGIMPGAQPRSAGRIPAPGNMQAAGKLSGMSRHTSYSHPSGPVKSPDVAGSQYASNKVPAAGFMPGEPAGAGRADILPAIDVHHTDQQRPVGPTNAPPQRPALGAAIAPSAQPDRSFLRAVHTKLPRVYVQPDAYPPSKLPAPGVLIGELVSPGGRITKIQRCVLAQDGHSNGEQVLYVALWNEAKPERDDSKFLTIGMGALSRLARMDISNVRKNIRSLVEKLSVEVIADEISDVQQGKTYRIFSYRRILENRRQAGLEWIIKSKGVTFIDPTQYGIPVPSGDIPAGRTLPRPGELPPPAPGDIQAGTAGNPPPAASGKPPAPPAGISQPLYRKELSNDSRKPQEESSSEIPPDLAVKLRQMVPSFDDDAVRALVTRCRKHDPDCSADEVEYCFQVKANQLLRRGKQVTNAVGLMLWAVPKCFEGVQPLHLAFREHQRAEREREAKADQEWNKQLAEYRRLVEDPSTSEEDRKWYLSMLNDRR